MTRALKYVRPCRERRVPYKNQTIHVWRAGRDHYCVQVDKWRDSAFKYSLALKRGKIRIDNTGPLL